MKKRLMTVLALGCIAAVVTAGSIYAEDTKSIIEQAQEMTLEELAAKAIEDACDKALADGYRTPDLWKEGFKKANTDLMTEVIVERV